jgi:hypothetical protein
MVLLMDKILMKMHNQHTTEKNTVDYLLTNDKI